VLVLLIGTCPESECAGPIYKSPLKDMGYDISDYKAIDERYGTLADWDALVADLHGRGMKLMSVSLVITLSL
jgi:maltooligosyltrehalose synthase